MPTPTPTASEATVSAALDRLASSRSRWALALDEARVERQARPAGLLALLTTWRAQPVVSLATGLWAAWSRRRARTAVPRQAAAGPALLVKGLVATRVWSVAFGVVRRHPVLALSGLAVALVWAGWRRHLLQRPSGPH